MAGIHPQITPTYQAEGHYLSFPTSSRAAALLRRETDSTITAARLFAKEF